MCGAVRFPTRQFLFTHQPKTATTALFLPLLAQLEQRARRTRRPIVLVLDNGVPINSRLSQAALEAASPHVRCFRGCCSAGTDEPDDASDIRRSPECGPFRVDPHQLLFNRALP